jgi:formamidopyrimidine-DNA glycosylase
MLDGMPELPEVETVRLGLSRLIVGKTIADITYDWPKSFPNSESDTALYACGHSVVAIRRRAKVLLIDLSSQYSLVVHLKMTGQLVFRGEQSFGAGHPNESLVGSLPDRSTRVVLRFSDGSHLFFNDQRKFGWVRLMPTIEIESLDFFKKVGEVDIILDDGGHTNYQQIKTTTSCVPNIKDEGLLLIEDTWHSYVNKKYYNPSKYSFINFCKKLINDPIDWKFTLASGECLSCDSGRADISYLGDINDEQN